MEGTARADRPPAVRDQSFDASRSAVPRRCNLAGPTRTGRAGDHTWLAPRAWEKSWAWGKEHHVTEGGREAWWQPWAALSLCAFLLNFV